MEWGEAWFPRQSRDDHCRLYFHLGRVRFSFHLLDGWHMLTGGWGNKLVGRQWEGLGRGKWWERCSQHKVNAGNMEEAYKNLDNGNQLSDLRKPLRWEGSSKSRFGKKEEDGYCGREHWRKSWSQYWNEVEEVYDSLLALSLLTILTSWEWSRWESCQTPIHSCPSGTSFLSFSSRRTFPWKSQTFQP